MALAISFAILPGSMGSQVQLQTAVSVQVTDPTQAFIPDADVLILSPPLAQPVAVVFAGITNSLGQLAFKLAPGRYQLFIIAQGFFMEQRILEVAGPSEALSAVLRVAQDSGPTVVASSSSVLNLTLHITDPSGTARWGASIIFLNRIPDRVKPDSAGDASIFLSPGTYKVVVTSPGFQPLFRLLTVTAQPSRVIIQMERIHAPTP